MKDSVDAAGDLQQLLASRDLAEAFLNAGLLTIDVVGLKFSSNQVFEDGKRLCKQFDGTIKIAVKRIKIVPRAGARKGKPLGRYQGYEVYTDADGKGILACWNPCGDLVPDGGGSGAPNNLSKSQQKAVQSLSDRIAEHKKKLADYIANPDAFDNQGLLKNAPTPEIRQRIIDGRIRHLESEIKAFQCQMDAILGGG